MKKEIFSVCLLSAMLIAAFINTHCIDGLTGELSNLIGESIDAVKTDDWETAENCVKLAEKVWTEKKGYTHIVLRHSEIDTVSDALYDYIICLSDHNLKASVTAAEKVLYHLDSVYSMEQLRFGSVF